MGCDFSSSTHHQGSYPVSDLNTCRRRKNTSLVSDTAVRCIGAVRDAPSFRHVAASASSRFLGTVHSWPTFRHRGTGTKLAIRTLTFPLPVERSGSSPRNKPYSSGMEMWGFASPTTATNVTDCDAAPRCASAKIKLYELKTQICE